MANFEKKYLLLFKKFVSVCVLRVLDGFVGGMLLVLLVTLLDAYVYVFLRGRCFKKIVFMIWRWGMVLYDAHSIILNGTICVWSGKIVVV